MTQRDRDRLVVLKNAQKKLDRLHQSFLQTEVIAQSGHATHVHAANERTAEIDGNTVRLAMVERGAHPLFAGHSRSIHEWDASRSHHFRARGHEMNHAEAHQVAEAPRAKMKT